MKKISIALLLILFTTTLKAQFISPNPNEGLLGGGLGVTWIDGAPYYSFHLFPEISLGKYGMGLNFKLEYGADGKIRTENFNELSDYLSIIRYLRYGEKGDQIYARMGGLDFATLGHGSIMYLYNNSPSYDTRKIGLELDADFGLYGFESVITSLGEKGIMGLRVYARPLQLTELASIPILGKVEVGVSYVTDLHDKAGVISGKFNTVQNRFVATEDEGAISIIGTDLEFPIVRSDKVDLDFYFDFVKIIGFGSGSTTGFWADIKGIGVLDIKARIERRFNGDNYIPSYFNSFYELERFNFVQNRNAQISKVQKLKEAKSQGNGYYGEMLVSLINIFHVMGSFQKLDNDNESGILHLTTEIAPFGSQYVARAGYDKMKIKDFGDLFKTDDRSHLYAEFGYKPMPYIICSLVYHWTFTPVRDADNNVLEFKTQRKVEPRISFVYPINVGN